MSEQVEPGVAPKLRTAVLVEGSSDLAALEALARRLGRDLVAEGVAIVSMGGATNARRHLAHYGPLGLGIRVTGFCDVGEEWAFRRGCQHAGLGSPASREELERLGFFVCVADLEDELIRAVGMDVAQQVIEEQGELPSFRVFQRQPAQRSRTLAEQLHRFLGTQSGRKILYARLLAEASDLTRIPAPLRSVVERV